MPEQVLLLRVLEDKIPNHMFLNCGCSNETRDDKRIQESQME